MYIIICYYIYNNILLKFVYIFENILNIFKLNLENFFNDCKS